MSIIDDTQRMLQKISGIYDRRRAALYALSLRYAAEALNDFRAKQSGNAYWENRTGTARDLVFSSAFQDDNIVGWYIAHGVEYGVYLELANDGAHQALRPTIEEFVGPFFKDAKSLFAG